MPIDPETIRQLDKLVRASIEDLADRYFHWLLIASAIVVIGVGFELPEVFGDARRWYTSKRGRADVEESEGEKSPVPPSTIAPLEQHIHAGRRGLTKLSGFVGVLVVILGVAGEGVFEALNFQADALLRDFNNALMADTYERAAFAIVEASEADEKSQLAAQRTSELEVKAIGLELEVTKQRGETEKVRQQNLVDETKLEDLRQKNIASESRLNQANQTLEEEKLRRVAMEDSLAPRELPIVFYNNESSSISRLKQFAGMKALIQYVPDAEAERAAEYVANVLRSSGWIVLPLEPNPQLNNGFYDGVLASWHSGRHLTRDSVIFESAVEKGHSEEAARLFIDWLIQESWQGRIYAGGDDDLPRETVKIMVGMKPNRFPSKHEKEWREMMKEWRKNHGLETFCFKLWGSDVDVTVMQPSALAGFILKRLHAAEVTDAMKVPLEPL